MALTPEQMEDQLLRLTDKVGALERKGSVDSRIPVLATDFDVEDAIFRPRLLDRDLDQVDHKNSTTETSLYSFLIPANVLRTTGGVRLTVAGTVLVNDGASDTLKVLVKLGSSIGLTTDAFNPTNSATRYKWYMQVVFMNSSTTAQKWMGEFHMSLKSDSFARLRGDSVDLQHAIGYGTTTETTTAALTLDVRADWSAASDNNSIRKEIGIVELLP